MRFEKNIYIQDKKNSRKKQVSFPTPKNVISFINKGKQVNRAGTQTENKICDCGTLLLSQKVWILL